MSKTKSILMTYIEVIVVFIMLCALLVLGSVATFPLGLWGTVLTELVMLAVLILISHIRRDPLKGSFPLKATPPRNLFYSLWLAVGGYFLISALTCFISAFVPEFTNTTDVLLYENYMKDSSPLAVVISVVAVPAFCEEMIFRGYFMNKLLRIHKSPVMPIFLSALLFGVLHFDLYKLPVTTLMGIVFGYIAWKTGSVIIPIILHMLNNALAVVSLYSSYAPTDEEAIYAIIESPSYLALGVIMLGIAIGPLFSGLRRFGTVRPKKWMRILCPILCIVIVVVGYSAFGASVTDIRLNIAELVRYPDVTEHTETFTVDDYSYCSIRLSVFNGKGVYGQFTVTDPEGEIVYELEGENCAGATTLSLVPGEYTIKCTVAPGENNTLARFDAAINESVVQTYSIMSESIEDDADDTGSADTGEI